MSQDIRQFVPPSCDLLALGEPTHWQPASPLVRNELFAQLAGLGFRSIALESDRIAAHTVNDFVQDGIGTLDTAMSEGFSHNFGELAANRDLVAWMREYNESRPPAQRLAFHGFDFQTENTSAPSPRRYLEHARDYLDLDLDLAGLCGDDERWSRTEAIMDPAMSIGATAEAEKLRSAAYDLLTALDARAQLIAATSRAEWHRARAHLTAGIGLLRYHKQAAQPIDEGARVSRLLGIRDGVMAQNLLDIRATETRPTLVFAHNRHLQKSPSLMRMGELDLFWVGAGAILAALMGERYTFIAGTIGRSESMGLPEPEPDTYEGVLQSQFSTWGLTTALAAGSARTRTSPTHAYIPLDQATLDGADAMLHINDAEGQLSAGSR